MSIVLKHVKIYTGDRVINDGYIRFSEKVEAVDPMSEYVALPDDEIHYLRDKVVTPGFIDVHTHGGYGFDTMDGNPDEIDQMVNSMAKEGVTSVFPTTMTQSVANIDQSMQAINEVAQHNRLIQGIHLEGPFIAAMFKGAQPEEYIQDPNVDLLANWDKLSGDRVRLITYAPEDPGAKEFEAWCLAHNVVPSVGHSNATREQLLDSKASHATHLYNAQREFKHREPGVTGHVMLEDNIYAELICDGFHIVPDMIKLAYEQKGPKKIELVTDSMRAKGMPEGISELGGQKVIVKDKQARLESGNLAGSVLRFDDAFRNIMAFTGCSMEEAVWMSSTNQATEFNLVDKGQLEVGFDADLNIFDNQMQIVDTYSYGKSVND